MKQLLRLAVLICLELIYSGILMAQTPTSSNKKIDAKLKIGDKVPDIQFSEIVNYKSTTLKLSSLKGKVIILDFWATWCGPCISSMPKLSDLQKKYPNDLFVLPISVGEKKGIVTQFFKKRNDITLPSVITDNDIMLSLKKYFPFTGIPHAVIIDKEGVVSSITSSTYITEENIKQTIAGEIANIPLKEDNMSYNMSKQLDEKNGGLKSHDILNQFRSILTKHIKGIPSTISRLTVDSNNVGGRYTNLGITKLYAHAYNKPNIFRARLFLENIGDPDKLIDDNKDPYWRLNNSYSYEYVYSRQISGDVVSRRMIEDLNLGFNLKSSLELREVTCFYLKKLVDLPINKSMGGSQLIMGNADTVIFRNFPMKELASNLENTLNIPIIDATGINNSVDLAIPMSEVNDFVFRKKSTGLIATLKNQGLCLEEGVAKLEVLVLKGGDRGK